MRTLNGIALALALASAPAAQLAVHARKLYTQTGPPLADALVLIEGGRIRSVGPAAGAQVPAGWQSLSAEVVTPGLIDAHSVVGLTGWLNYAHDQDQLDASGPLQPELSAVDAYDAREPLVAHLRSLGITTVHTGHAPGALLSGQTLIAKLRGQTVEQALVRADVMLNCSLGEAATSAGKAPGTRSKAIAMLRQELVKAQEYERKLGATEADKRPGRDLHLEPLVELLHGRRKLLATVQRARDIDAALRLAAEFHFPLVLDGAAEAYLLKDEIRAAGVPVIVHPAMERATGECENLAMTSAAELAAAGIPIALQSGFESYVPKTRVVLFEAAIACKYGLPFERALGAVTLDAARVLGIEERVGSLEAGKDADLALFDGDPFEYTSHCVATIIDGELVWQGAH